MRREDPFLIILPLEGGGTEGVIKIHSLIFYPKVYLKKNPSSHIFELVRKYSLYNFFKHIYLKEKEYDKLYTFK